MQRLSRDIKTGTTTHRVGNFEEIEVFESLDLRLLINDLQNNSIDWENKNLDNYLEGIESWVEDMDGYYKNKNIPIPEKRLTILYKRAFSS